MWYLVMKAAVSGALVLAVSEVAKRSPSFGAFIASLPLISILAMIWMWHETGNEARIASHAASTFWLVLPSLPMFLLFPMLLRSGINFYPALAIACIVTGSFYMLALWLMGLFPAR